MGQAQEAFSATGRHEETLVTGARADKIRECLRSLPARRPGCRDLPSAEIRRDKVYVRGPVEWGPRRTGLTLFYGAVGDDPTTFKKEDSAPLYAAPNLVLDEKTNREQILLGFTHLTYQPPAGSILLMPGLGGYLVRDGVYISIRAPKEMDVLDAARALRPMPPNGGSGAGG
jgi:hypothetical protein